MGTYMYDQKSGEFKLRRPLFSNILLADEINRAPPKTQAACSRLWKKTSYNWRYNTQTTGTVRSTSNTKSNRTRRYNTPSYTNGPIFDEDVDGISRPLRGKGYSARRKLVERQSWGTSNLSKESQQCKKHWKLCMSIRDSLHRWDCSKNQRRPPGVNGVPPRASQSLFKTGRAAAAQQELCYSWWYQRHSSRLFPQN